MFLTNLFLQAENTVAAAGEAGGAEVVDGGLLAGPLGSILPFVVIIAIFYFLIIRPQNKRQKETEKMIAALKKGDKVITIGGIHGVISSVKEHTVIVKVDDGAKIEFNRSAIATVMADNSPKAEEKTETAAEAK